MQHLQKALRQMNVQWTPVLTDITGAPGLAIIRAIMAGEQDPVQLARFRVPHGASRTQETTKALTGHDQPEHVLALKQVLALGDIYTEQGRTDEAEIARPFQVIRSVWPDEVPPLPTRMPHVRCTQYAVPADRHRPDHRPQLEDSHGANSPLGNRPRPAEVA
jgi:transposase